MLEQWIIEKLTPLKNEKLVILADPQRMIRSGAQAVDGWSKEHGFTVLFCSGNLALREMYEYLRHPPHPQPLSPDGRGEPELKIILVDRTREKAKLADARVPGRRTFRLQPFGLRDLGLNQARGGRVRRRLPDDRGIAAGRFDA